MPVDRVLLGACRGFREGPGFRLAAASDAYERRIGTPVYGLCFTPDGSRIVVGAARTVRTYDAHSGAELACVPMPDDVRAVSPDGSSVCVERHVYVSRAPNGESRGVLHDEHDHSLCVAFSADSRVIVGLEVGARPGRLRAWNADGTLIAELARVGGVGAFALSGDGKTVLLADDDFPGLTLSAIAIDGATKRAPIRLPREGGIRMVALSGDATRAVVAGQEGLRIVDLVSGESRQPFARVARSSSRAGSRARPISP